MTFPDALRLRYETLVRQHTGALHQFAYRMTGRIDAAQDLVQETFLEAWRFLPRQRVLGGERAWLFSILRHRWAHQCRAASRRIRMNGGAGALADRASPGASVVESIEDEDFLQAAIDRVGSPFKEAFLMVYLQGLTCREAAAALGVPLGTVLSRVSRAKETLRAVLEKPERQGVGEQSRRRAGND